jgi:hypothetical protein
MDERADELRRWCERAVELGADAATPIAASAVAAFEWVRRKRLWGCAAGRVVEVMRSLDCEVPLPRPGAHRLPASVR